MWYIILNINYNINEEKLYIAVTSNLTLTIGDSRF